MSDALRKHLTQVRLQQSGKMFCTSCQLEAMRDGGKIRHTANGRTRFVCAACVLRLDRITGAAA